MENEDEIRHPDPETAFCASLERYESECPESLLGAEPSGTVRIPPGRLMDTECRFRIFAPDFSGYRFVRTVFEDGACRCGPGGPPIGGLDEERHAEYWPYSFVPPRTGMDAVVFMRPDTPGGFPFTVWRWSRRRDLYVQRNMFMLFMFRTRDGFRDFVEAKASEYADGKRTELVGMERTLRLAETQVRSLEERIARLDPEAFAAEADLELSIVGSPAR